MITCPSGTTVPFPNAHELGNLLLANSLAYTLQMHLGQRVSTDPLGQQRRAQWTVTDRVSWFWCGQRLFDDPGYDWRNWLVQQWAYLGCPVVAAPATSVPDLVLAEAA